MADKKFLEEYSLYRKFDTQLQPRTLAYGRIEEVFLNKIRKPAINLYCNICTSDQTFNMVGNYYPNPNSIPQASGSFSEVVYMCESCKRKTQRYFLYFFYEMVVIQQEDGSENKERHLFVKKVGQFPPWDIGMDKNLEQILGDDVDYYKKGLVNESQSYGIGAYAYFRRITEGVIDRLLDSIFDLLEGEEKSKYAQALAKTKVTRVTQEKIDLVKDLLPASLRPDGVNPLEVLHSALSEGLHGEDDETCLEYADAIKNALTYLVNETIKKKEDSRKFTDGMRRLLEKKSQAGKRKDSK